ncbi:MAG: DUF1385 domain-containing protein [Armatimonadota bacterium]|nr:DUF1385 domain-containing protein [Armatimonadota bacterium]
MLHNQAPSNQQPATSIQQPASGNPQPQSFQLGGQALIEGVMMRSPHYVAAAVRHPDGSIVTRIETFESILKRYPLLNIPFLRGVIALFEMLALGMRYLNWSSNIALENASTEDVSTQSAPTSEPPHPDGQADPVATLPVGHEVSPLSPSVDGVTAETMPRRAGGDQS